MVTAPPADVPAGRVRRTARVVWTVLSWYVVESLVFGLSVLPAAVFWRWHFHWELRAEWLRILVLAMSFLPAYLIFSVLLMTLSAVATGAFGWRTAPDLNLRITDLEWPLLDWARCASTTHLTQVFAGTFLRSTPLWTLYLRLNGARVGHGVYVNSISLMDHNLLELEDGVVIGSDVHLAGHTVEGGVVRTARVRVGRNATIGNGSVVGIGVVVGEGAQIGALSVVPKHRVIEPGSVWAGASLRELSPRHDA